MPGPLRFNIFTPPERRPSFAERADSFYRRGTAPMMRGSVTGPSGKSYPAVVPYPQAINPMLVVGAPMAKAEGERGGKVIGHTASGKPIYDAKTRFTKHGYESAGQEEDAMSHTRGHKDFTAADHEDAARAHAKARSEAGLNDKGAREHHSALSLEHSATASEIKRWGKLTQPESGMLKSSPYACDAHKSADPAACPDGCDMRKAWEQRALGAAGTAVRAATSIAKSTGALGAVMDALAKAGEGSRGGKVIGHTSSGKPIYDSSRGMPSGSEAKFDGILNDHNNFSPEEHRDAGRVHALAAGFREHPEKVSASNHTPEQLHHLEASAIHSRFAAGKEWQPFQVQGSDIVPKLAYMQRDEARGNWGYKHSPKIDYDIAVQSRYDKHVHPRQRIIPNRMR